MKEENIVNPESAVVSTNNEQNYPPYNRLPGATGKAREWNKFRQATVRPINYSLHRIQKDNVPLKQLTAFMPVPQPYVVAKKTKIKKKIFMGIKSCFSKNQPLDFRVFVGLDAKQVPEYLNPFFRELAREYQKAQGHFRTVKEKCAELLTKEKISETKEGQYLIKLFELQGVEMQELILMEIIKKIKFTSEKGEQFLQQSSDWGAENIWTVATDFIFDENTQQFYSSLSEITNTQAFVNIYDAECRLIIFADSFHLKPSLSPNVQLKPSIYEAIIHETTHIVSQTDDLIKYTRSKQGFKQSGEEVLRQLKCNYFNLPKSRGFKRFVTCLSEYFHLPYLSEKTVLETLQKDPMLRSNLQIVDAEVNMIIIRDFAEEREFEKRPKIEKNRNDLGLSHRWLTTGLVKLPYVQEEIKKRSIAKLVQSSQQTSERLNTGYLNHQSRENLKNR